MRCFIVAVALVLACGTAHARDLNKDRTGDPANLQLAQAPPAAAPAATAPAALSPQAGPAPTAAPQASPAAQAAPETAAPPAAQPSKLPKKKQARRHETDEEKARRIAAKYGISW